jgi:hypothetical protein
MEGVLGPCMLGPGMGFLASFVPTLRRPLDGQWLGERGADLISIPEKSCDVSASSDLFVNILLVHLCSDYLFLIEFYFAVGCIQSCGCE